MPKKKPLSDRGARRCTSCGCWVYRITRCATCAALDLDGLK